MKFSFISVMFKKPLRFKSLTILFLGIVCLGTVFILKNSVYLIDTLDIDRETLLLHVNKLIKSGNENLAIEGQACRVPALDLNATEIMELLSNASTKIVCNSTRDWVEINGSTAKITSWAKNKYGDIECSFTDIIRENDYRSYQGMTTTTHTEYNLETSDVVQTYCTAENGVIWQKVLLGVRFDQDITDRLSRQNVPQDSLNLSVLMFGFDSLSHNMWKRKLPKTYKYATSDLKGIALNGYNIVGDGTPQALIPILTGKTELELPDTRKRMGEKAQFVNVYPFIWNDFQKNGFVTAYGEDQPKIGTFTYRLKGFKEQPVDHYLRTFYMEASSHLEREKKYCYGGESVYQMLLNFLRNLYEVYKNRPKFAFLFHSEYSHDNNDLISNADEDTQKLLQDLYEKGHLNHTLLILMSDHGSRFANFRNTLQGKQEERLPGFIFIFPKWFPEKYPEAYENFKVNADRLTTPFDIYETLKNVLHFEGAGMGNLQNRGISLFKEVPLSRTCQDAGIEPHWCTCLNWEILPTSAAIVTQAATEILNFLNRYTSKHRDLCAELTIKKIIWSVKLIPNDFILKFKKNSDHDGFVGDMSDHTKVLLEIYQLKLSFDPGNMIFEVSVRYYIKRKKFVVMENEISRINKYKEMTTCIEKRDVLHHLRKFCYCV